MEICKTQCTYFVQVPMLYLNEVTCGGGEF